MNPPGEHPHDANPPRPSRFPIIALVALAGGAFLAGASRQELWSSREGRVAACAQAMVETGEWIVPVLGDESRLEKPPLAYWLAAGAGLVVSGGQVTELAAKLPSVLAALGTVLLVFSLARRAFDSRRAAFFSALVLATSWLFWVEAHTASADMIMVFFITLAAFGFWRVLEENRRGQLDRILPWLALGAGFLAKGPVAVAVPLIVVLGYLAFRKRWKEMAWVLPSPLALVAFAALALPWYAAVLARRPEALDIWTTESFGRMSAEATSHREPSPFYYFEGHFWGAAAPWILLLPAVLIAAWQKRKAAEFPRGLILAFAWAGLTLVLFSASSSKRGYYLLPVLPGLALAAGWLLAEFVEGRVGRTAELAVRVPAGILGAVLAASPVLVTLGPRLRSDWPAGLELSMLPLVLLAAAGALILIMSLAPARAGWPLAESLSVTVACVLIWTGLAVNPEINDHKSLKSFCRGVADQTGAGQVIDCVKAQGGPCLVYYLGRERVRAWPIESFLAHAAGQPSEIGGHAVTSLKNLSAWRNGGLSAEVLLELNRRKDTRLVFFKWRGGGKLD